MGDLRYSSLAELLAAVRRGEHKPGPGDGSGLRILVDNDSVLAEWHPGWDQDGEELGDPEYLWKSPFPRNALHEALELLGLPHEDV